MAESALAEEPCHHPLKFIELTKRELYRDRLVKCEACELTWMLGRELVDPTQPGMQKRFMLLAAIWRGAHKHDELGLFEALGTQDPYYEKRSLPES